MLFKFNSTVDKRDPFLFLTKLFGFCLYRGNYRILISLVIFIDYGNSATISVRVWMFHIFLNFRCWTTFKYCFSVPFTHFLPLYFILYCCDNSPKWTPELCWSPEPREGREMFRELPWIKHLGCGYPLSQGLCICQNSSNTAQVSFHLEIRWQTQPSQPIQPCSVPLTTGSISVTLVTELGYWNSQSTNATALGQSQSCCLPPLQRTITHLQLSKRTAQRLLCQNIIKY